jgi:hypothetical protein
MSNSRSIIESCQKMAHKTTRSHVPFCKPALAKRANLYRRSQEEVKHHKKVLLHARFQIGVEKFMEQVFSRLTADR